MTKERRRADIARRSALLIDDRPVHGLVGPTSFTASSNVSRVDFAVIGTPSAIDPSRFFNSSRASSYLVLPVDSSISWPFR